MSGLLSQIALEARKATEAAEEQSHSAHPSMLVAEKKEQPENCSPIGLPDFNCKPLQSLKLQSI